MVCWLNRVVRLVFISSCSYWWWHSAMLSRNRVQKYDILLNIVINFYRAFAVKMTLTVTINIHFWFYFPLYICSSVKAKFVFYCCAKRKCWKHSWVIWRKKSWCALKNCLCILMYLGLCRSFTFNDLHIQRVIA